MAGGTTGRSKRAAAARATAKTKRAAGSGTRSKPKARKTAPLRKKSTRGQTKASPKDAVTLLEEQNEALRAELEQAKERIGQLEELNKNVVDRIDWVIDSLQSLLADKR